MNTDTHNTDRRAALNLPPVPLNDNHKQPMIKVEPLPLIGVLAVYGFGMATGFGIAMLAFTFGF
jgi:hypothetical protein